MSSIPGSSSLNTEGNGYQMALLVVGLMCCLIVILLLMRFVCNIAIDLCIMCSPREARRTAIEFRNMIFCCWLCPPQGPVVAPTTEVGGDNHMEVNHGNDRARRSPVVPLLEQCSDEKRNLVLATVIPGETVQEEHLKEWRQNNRQEQTFSSFDDCILIVDTKSDETSSTATMSTTIMSPASTIQCSICLHDMEIGHVVHVVKTCKHVFHRDCLLEWCSKSYLSATTTTITATAHYNHGQNTTATTSPENSNMFLSCPYCRQSIVSESQVIQAIHDCNETNTTSTRSTVGQKNDDEDPTREA